MALVDDSAALEQAALLGVTTRNTLWVVVHAFHPLGLIDRGHAESIVDDLLRTDMYLPIDNGAGLFAHAYREGLLP